MDVGLGLVLGAIRKNQEDAAGRQNLRNFVGALNMLAGSATLQLFAGEMPTGVGAASEEEAAANIEAEEGVRYLSEGEVESMGDTRTVPNTQKDGVTARDIHYTTDRTITSGVGAQRTYGLGSNRPTHFVTFPLKNVGNSVSPHGAVAADATQAATSLPIRGTSAPIPLEP
jgi:hypothetical protein